ncbi:FAD-binding oxidoreductase [Spirulina subsalsa FACHB-351]|uniref:FAD-binding oxidoreductase n=1 Tax=Spirulina subsalsa FACHB-351 TaxID=234711 RepID=A0ABT3L2J2_9CYAN|nr:FAD-dependent oxidoreductase [Spirulina subsalsa]MCW6035733.1 FAD-binding oxidoreductase [Spirulina subsalsa FACHB-351]
MSRVVIVGGGIVGAAIAYELSLVAGLEITLFDRSVPASGSTNAALGVLMGAISQKHKGRAWQLRATSIQRYATLLPQLTAELGQPIPHNNQGILMLCFDPTELPRWQKLIEQRASQGWTLELWDVAQLRDRTPQIQTSRAIAAIYSPQDLQLDPTALTQALLTAAQNRGVTCHFGVEVQNFSTTAPEGSETRQCNHVQTTLGSLECDRLVLAAGLGSTALTQALATPVDLRPVLGQALHLELDHPLSDSFQPVITGEDVHIVPIGGSEYWLGATVEFPNNQGGLVPNPLLLEEVRQRASEFCPDLATAKIIRTWSGQRPRPEGRPAPIIEPLQGYSNVILATGHYRNGVLLAPATALAVRDWMINSSHPPD